MKKVLTSSELERCFKKRDGFWYTEVRGREFRILVRIIGLGYSSGFLNDSSSLDYEIYLVIRETKKGYWFLKRSTYQYCSEEECNYSVQEFKSNDSKFDIRWTSKETDRRFAYDTQEGVLTNILKRTERNLYFLEQRTERAKEVLRIVKKKL